MPLSLSEAEFLSTGQEITVQLGNWLDSRSAAWDTELMNYVKIQRQNSTSCSDLALSYAAAGARGRGLIPCDGGALTPCRAPETNSTVPTHLGHWAEGAEMLPDNKVSAPWKTVPSGIMTRAYALARAFLQERALGR